MKPISQPNPGEHTPNPLPCAPPPPSAAQQDDDVDEQQADEDEREVDEELLQIPPGLRVHLDLGRPADGRLGHVLDALHGGRERERGVSGPAGFRRRERRGAQISLALMSWSGPVSLPDTAEEG